MDNYSSLLLFPEKKTGKPLETPRSHSSSSITFRVRAPGNIYINFVGTQSSVLGFHLNIFRDALVGGQLYDDIYQSTKKMESIILDYISLCVIYCHGEVCSYNNTF